MAFLDGDPLETAAGSATLRDGNHAGKHNEVVSALGEVRDWIDGVPGTYAPKDGVSILLHDAVGDGSTDDSSAFTAAAAAGDIIIAPEGYTFLVSDVSLTGKTVTGGGTIVKAAAAESAFHLLGDGSTVRGLKFAANADSGQPSTDIKIGDGATNVLVADNLFASPIYSAVAAAVDTDVSGTPYTTPASGVVIRGNRFIAGTGNYERPLYLHSVENVTITGNIIRDCLFDAIRLRENDGYVIISDNQFIDIGDPTSTLSDGATRDAVDSQWSGDRLIIANNVIRGARFHGLDIKSAAPDGSYGSQHVIIEGNIIEDALNSGIYIEGEDDYDGAGSYRMMAGTMVRGNSVLNCGSRGIWVGGLVQMSQIEGNSCAYNGDRGIYIQSRFGSKEINSHLSVVGNHCWNNGSAAAAADGFGILIAATEFVTVRGNDCSDISGLDKAGAQNVGIRIVSGAENGYTPTANSFVVSENVCQGNAGSQIDFFPSGSYANAIAGFRDNVAGAFRGWNFQRGIYFGTVPAAAEGAFRRGDIVFDTAAAASGTVGWVCVSGGTPGTWKTFGAISA